MITFTVYGEQKPHPRPRLRRAGKFARVYQPKTEWFKEVELAAAQGWAGKDPLEEPLVVEVDLFLPRPKSHFGARGLRPSAPDRPLNMRSGDVDNYAKSVLDAMNGVVYHDDALVTDLVVRKRFSDDSPYTIVCVHPAPAV